MATQDPISQQFEILRKRAKQAANTATQQEREGLQRRFAALGQVGSGAQIRAESQAYQRGAERLQKAEESVGLAELSERQRRQDISEQRNFQTAERLAGQKFSSEQAGLQRQFAQQLQEAQRKYATGERLSSQEFAALQASKGREYATGERLGSQEFASQEANLGREYQTQQSALARAIQEKALVFQQKSFDEGIRQFDLEFGRDSATIDFNKRMAELNSSKTLLDDLGVTGITGTPGSSKFGAFLGTALGGGPTQGLIGAKVLPKLKGLF